MADIDKAIATQLANIEKKTGKSLAQLTAAIKKSGKEKHGEIRDWLKEAYGLGHGDANTLTHLALKPDGASTSASGGDALAEIYSGKKAHLRPIHEALMAAIAKFGGYEIAPKKGYVSLRRKKQFAMLGPKTNERFELGLNLKAEIKDARVKAQPAGGMCQYIVALTSADEIDPKLIGYIKQAYDAAD
ncbi:MAG TPA: DUF5655 domain-containing protein [Terricaulis sp.]|nr:DUF5655 domain-containing protein [Terricaulis sp.]